MREIAREYVNRIGLKGHQYLVVKHNDSRHQHLHIVGNRVGYDGSITSDKWCKNRTARLCDHMEQKYHLTVARRHRRRDFSLDKITGKHRTKLEIRQDIQDLLDYGIRSLELLKKNLPKKDWKPNCSSVEMVKHTESHFGKIVLLSRVVLSFGILVMQSWRSN